MSDASGTFSTREKAQAAIEKDDWSICGYDTWQEVVEDGLVAIEEIELD